MTMDHALWRPRHNPWLVALTVTLATFMEVLDTSIANVALPHIAGSLRRQLGRIHLGAHQLSGLERDHPADQRVAGDAHGPQAVLHDVRGAVRREQLPVWAGAEPGHADFLPRAAGRGRRGIAAQRAGNSGRYFAPAKRGMAFAVYGMAVVVAPAIGPTLGGWITDNYSWRWIFYINVPVGIISLYLTYKLVEDPPYLHGSASGAEELRVDYMGLALVASASAACRW